MKLLGFNISREKALTSPASSGWGRILESFSGAWQKNVEVNPKAVLANHAVFSCMTLIASDIAKLRVKLVALNDGIWSETTNSAYSPVLRKPNAIQTRNQFWESWILSKLSRGNTYILKGRDNRGVVTSLHVLDPQRCQPLIAPDGSVYYQLDADNIAGITEASIVVPASEVIHDRFNCLFHPLVGISPIYASGLAATQGLSIQNNSANFFGNASRPGGLLIAPNKIDDGNAQRLKEYWNSNFTGENAGKIAVLGDGLQYHSLSVTPEDAQMVEQLKFTAEVVCSTFHVPPYKIGVGASPTATNVQALNLEYYSQCLQTLLEAAEVCLDEGLGTGDKLGTEFDIDNLLRMDSATQMDVLDKAKNILTLDERRKRLDAPPITGGGTVYLQQQDHSIEAIAARDKQLIEQAENPPALPAPAPPPVNDDEPDEAEQEAARQAQKALLRERVRERVNA
ncbi:phage portal protein [Qipengyuania pacifica]|uniref:phage portal protein n=1 Tax=Qipengyuania pacifica TaxID=2860199 RepID=UPI001C9DBCFF|nr:phage portal protein [Qipengyuania pacifica]MBY8335198.1 phage portal protein [Qipengyuania pacifica]